MKIHFSFRPLLLLSLLSFYTQMAVAGNYYYEQIALRDGLSPTVSCIYAEKAGFVWIGTQTGLGRFDGRKLEKYVHSPENPNSLPHDNILHIAEDSLHGLWILTEKGTARYRRQSDDFRLVTDQYGHVVMANVVCNTNSGILLGGRNKIYQYSYLDDTVTLLHDFSSIGLFAISYIDFWDEDTLLCCSRWQGILLLNLRTGEITNPPFDFGRRIKGVLVDSKGRVWVAPYNDGVRCLTRDGTLLASYKVRNSELSSNVVLCMVEKDSSIWIGTDGGGINILDPETHEISVLNHIPGDRYSLPCNSILSLYNDRNNNMWVGSVRCGLISIQEVSMKTYTEVATGNHGGLSNNMVLSLYQEPSSRTVWVGTNGGGINKFDPSTERFTHYPRTMGDKVVSITGYTSSTLLLSLFSKGLYTFNKESGECLPLAMDDDRLKQLLYYSGKTSNVYQYEPGSFLLLGDHIYKYTIATGDIEVISEKGGSEITGTLIPVFQDKSTVFLFDLRHIYVFDGSKGVMENIYTVEKDACINCVSRDENGHFWIATDSGLKYLDVDKQEVQQIPTSLFANAKSVLSDHHGKVWIGTDDRLFAWLVNEKKFILFGESDGALPNEYQGKPRLISSRGNVYLGGDKGLLYIDKNLPVESFGYPRMKLTNVFIDGESVNSYLSDGAVAGISVPWKSKAIAIHIMSCEKDIFRQRIYRYQIAGLNEQCIDSYEPEILIRSLPPGSYRIMATCSMRDGNWTPLQQVLALTVLPPWYRTWWFIASCVLVAAIIIIGNFYAILRRKENKLKWEMKEHEKELYEEKVRFLINISHELRTPLTLIYAPLNRILRSISPTEVYYQPLKNIYKQSRRMKNLLDMVLDLRKMEVGANKLQIRSYPLNDWIQEVVSDFITAGDARKVHLSYRLDARIVQVCFDKDKCEIVLTNLLINALKHSPENSEIIIQTELISDPSNVRISIIDQGCGLKQVDRNKLFTRFYQGGGERTGTGIGLSHSRILVELHGGKIGAMDNDAIGATFFFELPLQLLSGEFVCKSEAYMNELIPDVSGDKIAGMPAFNTEPHTLLIVDDNRDLLNFLKDELKGKFRRIMIATDGKEALEIIRKSQPEIVVSDVMMPRMDGYELCRQIKEDIQISHIPVILLTARVDDQSRLNGYKAGADAYLVKPFEGEVLLEVIRNRLQSREQTKVRYHLMDSGLLPQPEEATISHADETFLLKINKIIATHMSNQEFDVTYLCKEMCMSRATLYSKLKALTNMGGNDYINKFRIERVIYLITNTSLSFTEIAEKTGFSSSRYFSTMFKRFTGNTPSQYRESHRITDSDKDK